MAVVRCENMHFYDNVRFAECPHCKNIRETGSPYKSAAGSAIGENKTIAKFVDDSDSVKTQSIINVMQNSGSVDEGQKTIAKYFTDKNMNPISGWLVCTQGENKGRSFEIHIGKNFVGRSMKMDIHTNDERISRDNHFSIIYEPIAGEFYILQGNGMTYHNGAVLTDANPLVEDDVIEAGSSKYIFVPFCKKGRNWDD